MATLDDWIKALSEPPDDPTLKEIEEQRKFLESFKRGDYLENVKPEDTPVGKQLAELQKLRQDFEKYRADQTAYNAAAEKRHELAEKRQFWRGALAGAIGSTVANLFIFYWPDVVAFFSNLFQ